MDNMLFYVRNLKNSEEAITLLYNAAALNFAFSGDQRVIWEGIKAQEEALTNYCKNERERLAKIIREKGQVVRGMSMEGCPFGSVVYDLDGEKYEIKTEFGAVTNIDYLEV
ncbi:MAG: hypothetical protein IKK34_06805 [Clostridia bacterium]|nr:hypothetical protein [Clostridia bacterium]